MADQTEVPQEIQEEYYQTEHRERPGIAWLLAFGTLIATIAVAAGIFFGGRLAYRTFVDSDDPRPRPQTPASEQRPAPEVARENEQQQSQQGDGVQGSNTAPQSQSASSPSSSNPDSTNNSNIPNTGPGNTLAIFLGVSLFGYISHRLYSSWYTKNRTI